MQFMKNELQAELTNNILPFWMNKMVDIHRGGFYGRMDGNNVLHPDAEKGGILNARILWTFSAAYRTCQDMRYLEIARRAKDYILDYFVDEVYGGTYWTVEASGRPKDTKKQIYSIAFTIYALSEYYQAVTDEEALLVAKGLYSLIEHHSFDRKKNGYFEAYSREWVLLEDLRLSDKDANEKKTMNTHLHILEAYTNLFRIWKDDLLTKQLKNLIVLFLDKIVDKETYSQRLFFDENWNVKSDIISYGHDIEASWLLYEAASVLGDATIIAQVKDVTLKMVDAACKGLQPDGSLIYERNAQTGHVDEDRHWWVQAEAVVALVNAYQLTNNAQYLDQAQRAWEYIKNNLVDHQEGEWFWSILPDGTPNHHDDKAGFWKCPYHNGRMCMEIIHRSKTMG